MRPDSPWWATALQWGLAFVLISVVMGWLARTRMRPAAQTATGTVLKYPVSIAVFGAFAYLSSASPTGGPGVAAFFLLFVLLGCYLLYAYFMDRFEVRSEGLTYTTLRRGEQLARWEAIREVRYGDLGKWFVLRLHDGTVLRLSALLVGLPTFASALLGGVSPNVIAADSLDVLRQTAHGEPPRVW